MREPDTKSTRKTFARCADCGNEVAVLKRDDGSMVRTHDRCQECDGTAFEEVPPEELDELAEFTEWAGEGAREATDDATDGRQHAAEEHPSSTTTEADE
ncbi:hypothetical protein [Halomarina rubra]|uniref:Small CPxCG-related zinc finger protein n=1 Tax=Halomarina rubra TaxID=2071873 RepID=A0ABD6AQ62_9EURY|nr:hypothetical protein [Halomarina rubra]